MKKQWPNENHISTWLQTFISETQKFENSGKKRVNPCHVGLNSYPLREKGGVEMSEVSPDSNDTYDESLIERENS